MVIHELPDVRKQALADLRDLPVEHHDIDQQILSHRLVRKEVADSVQGNLQRLVLGIAVHPGGDQWKGHTLTAVAHRQFQGFSVAGGQQRFLAAVTTPPNWADGVDHEFRGKAVAFCDFGIAGFALQAHFLYYFFCFGVNFCVFLDFFIKTYCKISK